MKRKGIKLLALIIGVSLFSFGCSKVEPFKTSPENTIKISAMEDIVKNEETLTKSYTLEYTEVQTGKVSDDLQKELDSLKKKWGNDYDAKHKEFVLQTQELFVVNDMNDTKKTGVFDKMAISVMQYYINASRTDKVKDSSDVVNSYLSADLQKEDPIKKVKDYMSKNKIVITEVVFPETYEKKNTMMYPIKYTYSYILKGTIDGKTFEKQVTQDFYFGPEIKDFAHIENNFQMPLMYVKDHESK